jgi:hypothetical protein
MSKKLYFVEIFLKILYCPYKKFWENKKILLSLYRRLSLIKKFKYMKINTELIFRAICSFLDGEFANFTFYSIKPAAGEDAIQDGIKEIKKLGLIEDCTKNGYAKRFKIVNPLDCPDFIFDTRFDFKMRSYLLEK